MADIVTKQYKIGFFLFPNVTQLDLTAPLQVFSRIPGAQIYIVAKTLDPVMTDCSLAMLPTVDFESCPQLDIICVPGGGAGVMGVIQDKLSIDFVAQQCSQAAYITSVCTGAFILGAAGILQGRKATTHWAYTDLLALVGAEYIPSRIVRDENIVTAGGVTSGIDFALSLTAELVGEIVAKSIQLAIEYNPMPPFDCGSPDQAPPQVHLLLKDRYESLRSQYRMVFLR